MNVKIKGVYKHYKGDLYIVEDIATHSETEEELVIYRALYEETKLFARPLWMFTEKLDQKLGAGQKYRFELQDIKSKNKKK